VGRRQWQREGRVQLYYGDIYSLLVRAETENSIRRCGKGMNITSRMDFTNWEKSIYQELAKHQAPNKLLLLLNSRRGVN